MRYCIDLSLVSKVLSRKLWPLLLLSKMLLLQLHERAGLHKLLWRDLLLLRHELMLLLHKMLLLR